MEQGKKKIREAVFSILLWIFVPLYYLNLFPKEMINFNAANLRNHLDVSTFQFWLFFGLGILFNILACMAVTHFFIILFKKFKLWFYLMFFSLIKFLPALALVVYGIIQDGGVHKFGVQEFFMGDGFPGLQILLIIVSTLIGISLGYQGGLEQAQEIDNEISFPVSKTILFFVLIFSVYQVMSFLVDLSFVYIYEATKSVATEGRLEKLFVPLVFWGIYFAGLVTAFEALIDKSSEHRRIKIIGVFIVLPLLIEVIPLIRNRTWFF